MEPILEIVKIGDEVLREKCAPVKEFDSSLKMLTEAMFDELLEADGVGLAAPQIGIPQRFFVVDIRDGKRYVFINPEIVETSMEKGPYEEGCLSIPGVYHDVIRPLRVKIQARDANGKLFNLDADGMLARVIQHEYDHLDGHVFIDRGDEDFAKKTIEKFAKRQERSAKKQAEKEAKSKRIAAKIAAKQAKKAGK